MIKQCTLLMILILLKGRGSVNLKDVQLAKEFLAINGGYPTTILPHEMSEEEAEKRKRWKKKEKKS